MKRPLRKRILIIFAAALAAAVVLCAGLSYLSAYRLTLRQGMRLGRIGASIAETAITQRGLDRVADPAETELYDRLRYELRSICSSLSLEYLYIYTVDEEGVRHFIMTVATDDEEDELVARERGLGAVSTDPLDEQELAALRGEESDRKVVTRNEFGFLVTWITPLHDREGNVIGLIGADFSEASGDAQAVQMFLLSIIPVAAVLAVTFLILYFLTQRRIIEPIRTISAHMSQYDPSAPEQEPLRITSQDEMQQIADAFNQMSDDIRAYTAHLERITAEQAQAQAQMDIARRIQYGMVPASFREERGNVEMSAYLQPARSVGGDFYDSFFRDNGDYCAVIGDVSGKGVSAALFMAMAKTMIRYYLRQGLSPGAVLCTVNDELCASNPEGMFVTVFVLVMDAVSGEIVCANGGHNPPLLLRKGGPEWLEPDPGIALGLFEDAGIGDAALALAPGEGILLYTDGVTEAVSASGTFYGAERLRSLMEDPGLRTAGKAAAAVKASVEEFQTGNDPFDDMTILALFRRKEEEPAEQPLPVSLDSLDIIKDTVLGEAGHTAAARRAVLACDEALTNIVTYSGAENLAFSCRRDGEELTVVFRDDGTRFDPFAEGASPEKEFEELDQGGMGIRLIRQTAVRASWRYEDGKNVLELTFSV